MIDFALLSNCITSTLLLIAVTHLVLHWFYYTGSMLEKIVNGDDQEQRVTTALVATMVLGVMLLYNGTMYTIVANTISWAHLYSSRSLNVSVFRSEFFWVLTVEPIIFVVFSLFKVFCGVTQLLRAQSDETIMARLSFKMKEIGRPVPEVAPMRLHAVGRELNTRHRLLSSYPFTMSRSSSYGRPSRA